MKIGILGLGYVGLPLAVEFSAINPVVAFDINPQRIEDLNENKDKTLEVEEHRLRNANNISFTSSVQDLQE